MKTRQDVALWPIMPFGGEGEEGSPDAVEGSAGNTGSEDNAGSGAKDEKASAAKGSEDADDDDEDDEYKGLTPAELRKIASDNAKKAKDAEKARKAAQAKIDAEERKKNDNETNLTKDLESAHTENATLRAAMTRMAIIGAIRDDARYDWHDPEMVAQQLDPEKVTVDENGRVEGIKASLPKVAKDHPFLLKKDNTLENDKGNSSNGSGGTRSGAIGGGSNGGPTGFQPGQGGTSGGAGNETDTKKLAENYPALAARI